MKGSDFLRGQRQSLQYWLNVQTFGEASGPVNDNTRRAYLAANKNFSAFCRKEGIRSPERLQEASVEALQAYSDFLQKKGYSPATIHSRLAGPCRALGVAMGRIEKPRRGADSITRSRDVERPGRDRDAADRSNPQFSRLVKFQKAVGLRRAEIGRLKGRDLCLDESGQLSVFVSRGKGGKVQFQRILPDDVEIVRKIFQNVDPDRSVFSSREMSNHIDLHGLRAEAARRAYDYYSDRLQADPDFRKTLVRELVARYEKIHGLTGLRPDQRTSEAIQGLPAASSHKKAMDWIRAVLRAGNGAYRLRGEVLERAKAAGRPIVYDRLALLAVSVFHLSHWRLDVTVVNYLA